MSTFLELQTAVMGTRFDESQRGDVKTWINDAYWQAWTQEEWIFRVATDTVIVTANSNVVTGLATDVANVRSLQRSDGVSLDSMDPTDFERRYNSPSSTFTGTPEAYTVINGVVYVGPTSNVSASDYLMVYEKEYTALSADGDVPALPTGCHEGILVFGAIATGLQTENDFTWQFFQQKYDRTLDTLRRGYLSDRRDTFQSYTADPLGQLY